MTSLIKRNVYLLYFLLPGYVLTCNFFYYMYINILKLCKFFLTQIFSTVANQIPHTFSVFL